MVIRGSTRLLVLLRQACSHPPEPPFAIGSFPNLSSHAITYRWLSPPRVRRHSARIPQGGDAMTAISRRGMMAKAAAGGGGKGGDGARGASEAKEGSGEHGLGVVPINYLKDGKDPSIKPDEEYPDWLWEMQLPSLARLRRTKEDDYTLDEFRRFVQLDAREKIKRQNRSGKF